VSASQLLEARAFSMMAKLFKTGVHNLFVIAGCITSIFMKYGRQ